PFDLRGGRGRRVYERDLLAHDCRDGLFKERVVRAAEYEGVYGGLLQVGEITLCDPRRYLVLGPALLDERHEEGTGLDERRHSRVLGFYGRDVRAAPYGALGPDDPDPAGPCRGSG